MRNVILLTACLLLTACGASRTYHSQPLNLTPYSLGKEQKIAFAPPKQTYWKNSLETSSYGIVQRIFVPMNESPSDWTQSFYASYFPRRLFHGSTALLLKETQKVMKKICRETNYKTLTSPRSYLIYTISGSDCDNGDERFIAGKIMQGNDGYYELQYSALSNQVAPKYLQHGMNTVMSARLRD